MDAVVDWAPDGRWIAVGHFQNGALSIHDAETGVLRAQPIVANAGWVLSIDHADSRHLWVTAGTDGTVRLFDDETLAQVGSNIPAVDNQATTATVTDGGDAMVVVSMAGMGWRWDLDPGPLVHAGMHRRGPHPHRSRVASVPALAALRPHLRDGVRVVDACSTEPTFPASDRASAATTICRALVAKGAAS